MADIKKIKLGNATYDIVDASAVHPNEDGVVEVEKLQHVPDGVAEGFDFTGKNDNATAIDSTLTGTIPYGATGAFTAAFGGKSAAIGRGSLAEGTTTIAKGSYSHAEGDSSVTLGHASHAEGWSTTASGNKSHAEGSATTAQGEAAHSEGGKTTAFGTNSHAEGTSTNRIPGISPGLSLENLLNLQTPTICPDCGSSNFYIYEENGVIKYIECENCCSEIDLVGFSVAYGVASHVEGQDNIAYGDYSHAAGSHTIASGVASHAEGGYTTASEYTSHAEGYGTIASGNASHAEGEYTEASSWVAHAEGNCTAAYGRCSHAEGDCAAALGHASHAEGGARAEGDYSHAEGEGTEASGYKSHAEGDLTSASSWAAHAEGRETTASGEASHAEGYYATASGNYSHAEGSATASGNYSHAEGDTTRASGKGAHAEGGGDGYDPVTYESFMTIASGDYSHAEGRLTVASGEGAHSEGRRTVAFGAGSHAEGTSSKQAVGVTSGMTLSRVLGLKVSKVCPDCGGTNIVLEEYEEGEYDGVCNDCGANGLIEGISIAYGTASHVEGTNNIAYGNSSHAEGNCTIASGVASHAEGGYTTASEYTSHAEGSYTTASGDTSHAEGFNSTASGDTSHAEGFDSTASGYYSHAEGTGTTASGESSHAEGGYTTASGYASHAEGESTTASGSYSHAEGYYTTASGYASHAEGEYAAASGDHAHAEGFDTAASGESSHAEGCEAEASGEYSHAEGYGTAASNSFSHAEGSYTTASGLASHAEGSNTTAAHTASHAGGYMTYTTSDYQTVVGTRNTSAPNALFVVGNGYEGYDDNDNAEEIFSNAFTVNKDGTATVGADPINDMDVATKHYIDTSKFAGSSTAGGPANSAKKLETARTINLGTAVSATATSFNGTSNITIPVNSVKEAYLTWGGKNFAGSWGPIDAAMVPELGANRLAFFPVAGTTIEYSTDKGATWSNLDNNNVKIDLFSTGWTAATIGNSTAINIDKSSYMIRITLDTTNRVYTALNKFAIRVSTAGSTGCYCTIEAMTNANRTAGNDTWDMFANKTTVNGWSGYNIINIPTLTTYGGQQQSQYSRIRLTFGVTSHPATSAYPGLQVLHIMAFGGEGWTTPSNLAKNGHLYSWDRYQTAAFPANITGTQITGTSLIGNSYVQTPKIKHDSGVTIESATDESYKSTITLNKSSASINIDDGGTPTATVDVTCNGVTAKAKVDGAVASSLEFSDDGFKVKVNELDGATVGNLATSFTVDAEAVKVGGDLVANTIVFDDNGAIGQQLEDPTSGDSVLNSIYFGGDDGLNLTHSNNTQCYAATLSLSDTATLHADSMGGNANVIVASENTGSVTISVDDTGAYHNSMCIDPFQTSITVEDYSTSTTSVFVVDKDGVNFNDKKILTEEDYITAGQLPGTTLGAGATAEGYLTTASGDYSHAEGYQTGASGDYSHTEGYYNFATAGSAHAEGSDSSATGYASHAEGYCACASGYASHAEGGGMEYDPDLYSYLMTTALGDYSHAEGYVTMAYSRYSHAEGFRTTASHTASHAGGSWTRTSRESQTVIGQYNADNEYALFIVGNGGGPAEQNRSNAFVVNSDGTATVAADPIVANHVATKNYIDSKVGDLDSTFFSSLY